MLRLLLANVNGTSLIALLDLVFEDYDVDMEFSTLLRLLQEQTLQESKAQGKKSVLTVETGMFNM